MPEDSGFLGLGKVGRFVRSVFSRDILARTGLDKLVTTIRERVGQITTPEVEQIQRQAQELEAAPSISDQVEADNLIPYSMMRERGDLKMTKNAQYRTRMKVVDPETGQSEFVYRSIASDQHFTESGIKSLARELFTSGGAGYEFEIEEVVLEDVWIQPGAQLVW